MNAKYLTTKQAAQRLNVAVRTVQDLVARGELPALRIGRAIRIPVAALERWEQQHTEGGEEWHDAVFQARTSDRMAAGRQ